MTNEQQRKLEMLKKLWKEYEDGENVGEKWASYDATFAATFDTLLQIIDAQQAVVEAARAYRAKIENLLHETGANDILYEAEWNAMCDALDHIGRGTAPRADGQGQ